MRKKSIIAFLLACSFAFGAAAFTGCNVVGGGDPNGNQNQTDNVNKNDNKDENKKPEDENKKPEDENKKPEDNKDPEDEEKPGDDKKPDTPTTVKVTGLTLLPSSITLDIDGTQKLVATVAPTDATNKTVIWSSDKTSVATVDTNGLVTAKAAGNANITAKTEDGNFTKTCAVTVKAAQTNPGTETEKPVVSEKITYSYSGNECEAFEWMDSHPANEKVEYKLSTDSTYTRVDSALVRASTTAGVAGTARVDVVGLKGGAKYDFKITPSSGTVFTAEGVTVHSYDRSGYAHFGKDGVGAYNNDGTPKNNAKIIYLTEANKNNVDGSGKSIAQYLANAKNNSTPIIIRVVGTVGSATWNLKDYGDQYGKATLGKTPLTASLVSQLTPRIDGKSGSLATSGEVTYYQDSSCYGYKSGETLAGVYNTLNLHPSRPDGLYANSECAAIKGLNSYMKVKSGEYDSCWNDCPVKNVQNDTIEGIGEAAEI
ncbi:MAG: Ig-like domain-containing protein, partial [Clostridia bacterium]|nr:Ig-like domain-containing protein [Clostridia bacterium]